MRGLCWLVVKDEKIGEFKEILWCYCEGFDLYVKVGEEVVFYGYLDKKVIILGVLYEGFVESLDEEYDLWFCIGCVLEYWYIGIMICCVFELYCVFLNNFVWMYLVDVKKCGLCYGDKVKLIICCGEMILYLDICGCNKCLEGLIFIIFFDVG